MIKRIFLGKRAGSQSLHHAYEIKRRVVWYKRTSVILSLFIISTTILASYIYLNYTLYTTYHKLKSVSADFATLQKQHNTLKMAKVRLQRELEISKQSQFEINTSLIDLHQQTQDLTEQLDLYKRITSANRSSESILVENLHLRPLEKDTDYVLSWVMLQASKKRNLLQGKLNIKIAGQLGDNTKIFNYSQLAANKKVGLTYKFRDFQHFNNKIVLPKDFNVDYITIEILDNKTKITKSKTFNITMIGRKFNVAQTKDISKRIESNA